MNALLLLLCANIGVFFSPNGGCTEAVVSSLGKAKATVLIQAYYFTSPAILKALSEAKARGVTVEVILDKSQDTSTYSPVTFLRNAKVPTWIDAKHAIAHNKIMVIDSRWVLTGSFNFTRAAQFDNAENLLLIDDPELAVLYAANWNTHKSHSKKAK